MKQNSYRYPYTKKKRISSATIFRIIVLILCAVLVWIFYKDRFYALMEGTPASQPDEDLKSVIEQLNKPPVITVSIDGRNYRLNASETSETASPASEDAMEKMNMVKNSKLKILFNKPPESFSMTLYKDNSIVFSGVGTSFSADDLPGDGEYTAVCEAEWNSGNYKGTTNYHFTLLADFPYELSISSSEIDPGELLVICAENLNSEESLEVETDLDYKPNAFQYGNKRVVMLPVSYYNIPGKIYQVKVIIEGETHSYALKLNEKAFTTQYMTIDTKVAAATRNDKSAEEVEDKINPLKPVSDAEPYWSGNFIMPVEGGRVAETDFGKKRYVNNAPTSYRHNGLDIGQDKGTPVMASNNGRVLLAEFLIGTGNTVIIEHGFGLKTWYYHMDELLVKTGDQVMQSDIIGKVGSTGFSTGPHLHFSASVNGVFINPITLINGGVPLIICE